MTSGHLYSLLYAYVGRINSSAYATNQLDPDSVGVGPTVSPATFLKGPVKLSTAKAQRATVEWRGGSAPEGKRTEGVESIGAGTLEVTRWDNVVDTVVNNGLVDTTSLTNAEISSPNNMNPSPNPVYFVGICKINIPGSPTPKYKHFVYPNCTISRVQPDTQQVEGNQKNPNNITYTIEPNIAYKFPVGKAFGSNQAWYGNSEFEFTMDVLYPMMYDVWIADGTATTFTLSAIPKKSTVTAGHADNWVTKNGAETAPSSINTTNGLVTVAAAGTAADIWNVWYPVAPNLMQALAVA